MAPPRARLHLTLGLSALLCAASGHAEILDAVPDSAAVVRLANAARERAGIPALKIHERLTAAAQLHAGQMARVERVAHLLDDSPYPRPEDRLAAVGYVWRARAENLAFNQPDAAAAVEGWLQSAEHRANIVNPMTTETGVGVAMDTRGRPYWVQVFASPAKD